ncbi:MAG: hypothetical protein FWG99_11355 [Treponema sp.]|nr:hypothetical protein [Treponema sp.]
MLFAAAALYANESVVFHNFPWGTSIEEFTARMGNPVHQEKVNDLSSLIYENVQVSGYSVYMMAYFSANGLEGGTYYFLTNSFDELIKCYADMQTLLIERFGQTLLCDLIIREMRLYETSWNMDSGYVHLKVNTRFNEPVTLWYSSPELTRKLTGS